MPALSALDLAMFMLESPERPFNIGPLVLLRPPAGFKGNFADKLLARMLQRPPGPPFNYRLQLSLTRAPSVEPVAVPDLQAHVHRLTLKRASTEQLLAKVCELHESLLDRDGPLWQFWAIDGLADGRVALYGKVHHGIIDGRGFVGVITRWLSEEPSDKQVRAMWDGVERPPRDKPRRASLLQALRKSGAQAGAVFKSATGLGGLMMEQGLRAAGLGQGTAPPFLNVPDAFDGKLSPKRSYAYCTLPIADIKALGKAHGATVNDLLLTVADMAMQRWLAERGKPPAKPLVADMPVALGGGAKGGNQIAVLQFPLGRSQAVPAERLQAIRTETGKLKASLGKRSSDTVMLYTTLVHALPLLLERVRPKAAPRLSNLLISNPFGLQAERYLMGAKVDLVLPMSVVTAGHKLNITAVTLGSRLQIGFLAMPDAVPDIASLARHTEQAWAELARALAVDPADTRPAPAKRRPPARKTATRIKAAAPRRARAATPTRA